MKPKVALEILWDTRSCWRDCANCIHQDNKCIFKEAYKILSELLEEKEGERNKGKNK